MNKTLIGLGLALILGVGALLFLRKQENTTPEDLYPQRRLAVEDAQSIHRIFVADLKGRTADFELQPDGNWLMDGEIATKPTVMREMVNVLGKIRIDHVPPQGVVNQALKEMKGSGINVKAFDAAGNLLKSIIIGSNSKDDRYSYVVVEGYDEPFAVRVPGLTGSIRPLFTLHDKSTYRSNDFVKVDPEEVLGVQAYYPRNPGESFVITRTPPAGRSGQKWALSPVAEVISPAEGNPSDRQLESYIETFANVPLVVRADTYKERDSITSLIPFVQYALAREAGDTMRLRVWPLHLADAYGEIDFDLPVSSYYVERDGEEFAIVQTHQLQPWFRGYTSFFQ